MKIRLSSILKALPLCFIGALYLYLHSYASMSHLTNEDLKWIQSSKVDDTIYFANSTNASMDTLIVKSSRTENKRCKFNFSPFCWRNEYHAMWWFGLHISHNGILYDSHLFIEKLHDSIPCSVSWNIMRLIADDDYIVDSSVRHNNDIHDDFHTLSLSKVSIEGFDFGDCIIGTTENSHLHKAALKDSIFADEIIWSKEYGLLQYKMAEEIYTRTDIDNL